MKETELAKYIIEYLESLKWDVYQEVQLNTYGSIADIVAIQNNLVWVIETKTSLSLDLIAQAEHWTSYANYVSVAIPYRRYKNYKKIHIIKHLFEHYGIGCLMVSPNAYRYKVEQYYPPKLHRKAISKYFKECVTPEHKTFAEAGNADGKRYTPFQATCEHVKRVVKNKPGITLKELINTIDHHYANDTTAKACISKWIDKGIIEGIEKEYQGRTYHLYLKDK